MNMLIRLILLFTLFVTSQLGMASVTTFTDHQYEVNHIVLDGENYGYDATSNPQYCCQSPLSVDVQNRTFLSFVSDFLATKSLGKVDPNKLNHVFGQQKHELGPLLDKPVGWGEERIWTPPCIATCFSG